jgi:hypothetical protein
MRKGWTKKRKLPPWLKGRQLRLYIVLLLFTVAAIINGWFVGAIIKGRWFVWLALLFILCVAGAVALAFRSRDSL